MRNEIKLTNFLLSVITICLCVQTGAWIQSRIAVSKNKKISSSIQSSYEKCRISGKHVKYCQEPPAVRAYLDKQQEEMKKKSEAFDKCKKKNSFNFCMDLVYHNNHLKKKNDLQKEVEKIKVRTKDKEVPALKTKVEK